MSRKKKASKSFNDSIRPRILGKELLCAVHNRAFDKALTLVARGADVNMRGLGEATALIFAARYGRADLVRALLEKGADPNAHDKGGNTPLIMAASWGTPEAVRLLLEHGASPFHRDTSGLTALANAHMLGCSFEIIRQLEAAQKEKEEAIIAAGMPLRKSLRVPQRLRIGRRK